MAEPGPNISQGVRDPAAWRAMAHPLRLSILERLVQRPSLRARDLAADLGEPANSVSFHLRQLARFGLVEPDPDPPSTDARERWWRATSSTGPRIPGDAVDSEDAQRSHDRLSTVMRHRTHERVDAWWDALSDPTVDPVTSVNADVLLRLDPDALATFRERLGALIDEAMRSTREQDESQPDLVDFRLTLFGVEERP